MSANPIVIVGVGAEHPAQMGLAQDQDMVEALNLLAQPAGRRWSWWGRVIFYVANVDELYYRALAAGCWPTTAPRDAEWGERFFHLVDPDGHELSFARLCDPRSNSAKRTPRTITPAAIRTGLRRVPPRATSSRLPFLEALGARSIREALAAAPGVSLGMREHLRRFTYTARTYACLRTSG
jgi:hypothetical protein